MATCVRKTLKSQLIAQEVTRKNWFQQRLCQAPCAGVPFYSSFDLRDADYKIAPVDANLFPAGFNNICPEDLDHSGPIARHLFERLIGHVPDSLVIIPENHTRNQFYTENLYELRQIFKRAGIRTEIGWYEPPETTDSAIGEDGLVRLLTPQGLEVIAYPLKREGNRLTHVKDDPQFILLNNDFSSGFPDFLSNIEQPVLPSPRLGWHTRRKDTFFRHYNEVVREFSEALKMDPWPLTVLTEKVENVDFQDGKGLDQIEATVDAMLFRLKREYADRDIKQEPFVFIKNNAGTYGMGIMRVSQASELRTMNRRDKNKMTVGKGNRAISDVIVQEGIPTRFKVEGAIAEPVIYMMGTDLLGGFLRKNPTRGADDNLNSKGMVFQRLCISDLKKDADRDMELELVYGTIAQISAVALSRELKAIDPQR